LEPAEKNLLLTFTTSRDGDQDQPLMPEYIKAQWPLPIIKMNEDPNTASVEALAKQFDRMLQDSDPETSEAHEHRPRK